MNIPISLLAVLVSAVAATILGTLWYGPLFGKEWMRLVNISPEQVAKAKKMGMVKSGMLKSYALMFVGSLITSYILGVVIFFSFLYFMNLGMWAGSAVGFFLWLGFVAPVTMGPVLWEGKSWKLWLINNSFYLVSFIVSGLIFMWMA